MSAGILINTKLTLVMWCQIFIGRLQCHLAVNSAGNRLFSRPEDKINNFKKKIFYLMAF